MTGQSLSKQPDTLTGHPSPGQVAVRSNGTYQPISGPAYVYVTVAEVLAEAAKAGLVDAGEGGEAETLLRLLVARLEDCELTTDSGNFEEIESLLGDAKTLVGDA